MSSFDEIMANDSVDNLNGTVPAVPACWPILIDPTTNQLLEMLGSDPKFLAVMGTAIALTVFTVVIYFETLWFLCRKIPSRRKIQLSFIMGIYPVFSVTSLLAMFMPRASIVTNFTAHVYFSLALVQFIMLLTGYYGDKVKMLRTLEGTIMPLATPPLSMFCFCCLPKIPINKYTLPKFIKVIRGLVLQVAVIKPLFFFLAAILWLNETYVPGDFSHTGIYLWFNIIYIVSTLFALNGIIVFYKLSRVPLKEFNLTPKFLTVQLTLILTNAQTFTIGICALTGAIPCKPPFHPGLRALYMDSMLNIIEMFLFNIFATVWYRRMKGNVGQEKYSRLSHDSYLRDPAVQIALGDENDKTPGSESSLFKTKSDGIVVKQNGGSASNFTHTTTNDSIVWRPYGKDPTSVSSGNEHQQPFLHVIASQLNGSVACKVMDETQQRDPVSEAEKSSIRSGSNPWSGSGSDRETDV